MKIIMLLLLSLPQLSHAQSWFDWMDQYRFTAALKNSFVQPGQAKALKEDYESCDKKRKFLSELNESGEIVTKAAYHSEFEKELKQAIKLYIHYRDIYDKTDPALNYSPYTEFLGKVRNCYSQYAIELDLALNAIGYDVSNPAVLNELGYLKQNEFYNQSDQIHYVPKKAKSE